MKKLILIPVILCFLLFISCTVNGSSSSTADPETFANTAKQGTWRVTNFNNVGVDETSHFTGYNFTFEAANALSVTNGTNSYSGTWSPIADAVAGNPTGIKLNITIASPPDFAALTKGWVVASYTGAVIYLTDSASSDVLVFTKN